MHTLASFMHTLASFMHTLGSFMHTLASFMHTLASFMHTLASLDISLYTFFLFGLLSLRLVGGARLLSVTYLLGIELRIFRS